VKDRLLATELYEYVVSLQITLEGAGELKAAAEVLHLSRFASGSMSEFFGEARVLLPRLLKEQQSKLPDIERAQLQQVIVGIEREFDLVGGA